MRTRIRYPDNPGVMYGDYRNALCLGFRGFVWERVEHFQGEKGRIVVIITIRVVWKL